MKKRAVKLMAFVFSGMLLFPSVTAYAGSGRTPAAFSTRGVRPSAAFSEAGIAIQEVERENIIVPTIDEVRRTGYPVNEYGETYGPMLPEIMEPDEAPDLLLAENRDGVIGYVREKDLDGPDTLEGVLAYMENPEEY